MQEIGTFILVNSGNTFSPLYETHNLFTLFKVATLAEFLKQVVVDYLTVFNEPKPFALITILMYLVALD